MTLGELLSRLDAAGDPRPGDTDETAAGVAVTGVAYDSRRVEPGAVFVALRGQHADGATFARDAIERGAAAVVAEADAPVAVPVPWRVVSDARAALAVLAAAFHGHPSRELMVIGVTGTNGKTTTSYLVQAMFEQAGIGCGRVGTVGHAYGSVEHAAERTTPEAPDLQALLRDMVDRGCGAGVLEVSSHALALKRVDSIRFGAAVFTNLSRDHLDFHGDMESYYRAKRRLFEMLPGDAFGVVNLDDVRANDLLAIAPRPVSYAIDRPADVAPVDVRVSADGISFDVRTPRGLLHARSRLMGHVNVANVLAAVAVCMALDLPFSAIEQGIAAVERVPGRCELVSNDDDDVRVVVDYAHTDDALRRVLETLRPLAAGSLVCVFGCGGDRDRTKRPLMGAVASRLSDRIVVTSDNPRSEDPAAIIDEVLRGVAADARSGAAVAIVDRRQAIARAVADAEPGDLVVIAGRGHEQHQEIGGRILRLNDAEAAREALDARRSNSRV